MKYFFKLIIIYLMLPCGLLFSHGGGSGGFNRSTSSGSKPKTRPPSTRSYPALKITTITPEMAKERFIRRKQNIRDGLNQMDILFDQSDSENILKELPSFADECLHLEKVAYHLKKKRRKEIKKLGKKIEKSCRKIVRALEKKNLDKASKNWSQVNFSINELIQIE